MTKPSKPTAKLKAPAAKKPASKSPAAKTVEKGKASLSEKSKNKDSKRSVFDCDSAKRNKPDKQD